MRRARSLLVLCLAAVICSTLGTAVATVAVRQGARSPAPAAGPAPTGVRQLEAVPAAAGDLVRAVATFPGATPPARRVAALRDLDLQVQPLRRLPLALVAGTKEQLRAAVAKGAAADVYPDEPLQLFSAESTASMGADVLRAQGLTGKGVGVAIVDSGIDATHPDLADHVTHNVKMVGPENLDVLGGKTSPDAPPGTFVVPVEQTPYNNSDTTSGHGTHVAGIVAADAHTSPAQVGVAPDAHLIGYGTGDALFIYNVLAAFDDILVHRRDWGIRVVNNSWGSAYRAFDPDHPINVATKAVHDAGVVVVFAAGNSAEEMTVNPWSVAPWVISVGSTTKGRERSDFSSGGLEYDNSLPARLGGDGEEKHVRFAGDRVGLYHPDVSAPGTDIESSGTPTGAGMALGGGGPTPPGGTTTLSGTSMASPHVAGLAALLLEARPSLTPDQVRDVLQVTAAPLADRSPFWRAGYGFADAQAAVALVRRPDFGPDLLARLQAAADARVLADRPFSVRRSDVWVFPPVPATALGSDTRTFTVDVTPETKALKATVAYPTTPVVDIGVFEWQITLLDAAGKTVATSRPVDGAPVSSVFVDLVNATVDEQGTSVPPPAVTYGRWTVEVAGVIGAADPTELLDRAVTLSVAQLVPQLRRSPVTGPRYVASGSLPLFFQPGATPSLLPSPEGCATTAEPPRGRMAATPFADACWSGPVGFAANYAGDAPAEFTSAVPFDQPVVVGGPSVLTLYLADPAQPAWSAAASSSIAYVLEAVDAAGRVTDVAGGTMERRVEAGPEPTRGEYGFDVAPTTVPAGTVLRLRLRLSGVYTSGMRMLYGGDYADAGLTLPTGSFQG